MAHFSDRSRQLRYQIGRWAPNLRRPSAGQTLAVRPLNLCEHPGPSRRAQRAGGRPGQSLEVRLTTLAPV